MTQTDGDSSDKQQTKTKLEHWNYSFVIWLLTHRPQIQLKNLTFQWYGEFQIPLCYEQCSDEQENVASHLYL